MDEEERECGKEKKRRDRIGREGKRKEGEEESRKREGRRARVPKYTLSMNTHSQMLARVHRSPLPRLHSPSHSPLLPPSPPPLLPLPLPPPLCDLQAVRTPPDTASSADVMSTLHTHLPVNV